MERIGWDTYVKNWRNAKIEATKKVAEGFASSATEAFSHNFATLDQYHSTTIEGGKQLATRSKESIATSYQQTQAALAKQAAAAKLSATQTYKQQIAGVRNQQAQKLQQINTVEAQLQATLEHKGGEAIAQIQKLGGVLRSSVEGAISTGQVNLARAVSGFSLGLNSSDDPKALARATVAATAATAALDEAFEDAQYDIDTATKSAIAQIKTTTGDIIEGLSGVAQAASMQQASSLFAYSEQLKQQSAEAKSSFDSMLTGLSQMLEETVDRTVGQWNPIPEQMVESLIRVEVNLGKQLTLSETQVIAQRESIMTKLGAEIRSKSKEEAGSVQPGWKKVLKMIVNIVITVVVTVAITALAMSGVGLVAGLALAALIGAVGGIAKLAANSAIDGKPITAGEFFKAAGIGALTGVMEFAGGRAILAAGKGLQAGMVSKIEHLVLDVGVQTATNTAVEITERLAQGEDFTLKMLGIAVGTSLVSAAGGKYINVKFNGIAEGATQGATRSANQGLGRATGEFVADTALDTTVNTAGAVANGEELSLGMVAENAAGSVMGKGVAGQASSLYGDKLTGLGQNKAADSTPLGKGKIGQTPKGKNGDYRIDLTKKKKEGQTPIGDTADKAPRQPAPTNALRNSEFERVASEGLSRPVEVYSDPDLVGNTVRAEYKLNSKGLVEEVHLRAGPDATANDIKLHQQTVKVMRQYGGILGRVRLVEAKIAKWVGINGVPKPGTKAWEAQLEVRKLDGVIGDRMKQLQTADPQQAQRLESEVKYLQQQLKEHRRTFERMDRSQGVGYVAALGDDKIYGTPHDASDNIRKRQDVQDNAETINAQEGTKENPKVIPPGLGLPSFVAGERSEKAGIKRTWSSTNYQVGQTNVTAMQGPGIRYNKYIKLGNASKYSDISRKTINKIKQETGYDDFDIAVAWRDKIKGKSLPRGLQGYEGQLDRLTMLMFGSESIRNTGNIVHAPMTLDLIASKKDPMTWKEALEGYEPDNLSDSTQRRLGDRGAFPMSMTDAQISALYLEAQRKGEDPVEYLLEERWQRLKPEQQTPEKREEERKKIVKKLEKKEIIQKAEELKKREIELTKRWLTNVGGVDLAQLDLMDEQQAVKIIERVTEEGTLDFYLNRRKNKRRKTK